MTRQYPQPGVTFAGTTAQVRLWAPYASSVALSPENDSDRLPMEATGRGWWTLETDALRPGDRYRFLLDDKTLLPDPASRAQPEGVHGPSQALPSGALAPRVPGWNGVPLSDYIVYEIHTGTFSDTGTFGGIAAQLDELVELGITAIEIMPVAAFPGKRNWGYDGVFPFAVHADYGGATGLAALVAAAHEKGLAVILDVVYNHLGPEGNYFGSFGPYFTDKYKTPWGSAINFDDAGSDAVRDYFITNALMWLRDFDIDALRLDAVHAIKDFSARHFLEELRTAVDSLEQETGRQYYLIIENDLNDPRFINDRERGGFAMDAQWVDEFHHALRVASGQPQTGYYSDFNGLEHLAKSYRDAYVYDGQYSPHRDRSFGAPAGAAPGKQFLVFSQNHDQVGNRMLGERTASLLAPGLLKVLAAAVMLSPYIPMLFMGEEWAETAPFLYFISHSDPALIEAVRKGRREEFASFHATGTAPDPQAEDSFLQCRLRRELRLREPHASTLAYYKDLIRLRKTHPALGTDRIGVEASADVATGCLRLTRRGTTASLLCLLNFSDQPQPLTLPDECRLLLSSSAFDAGTSLQSGNEQATPQAHIPPASCLIYEFDV